MLLNGGHCAYRGLPDRQVKEVETFAQFGSIFLLFGHGLTYSTFMNTGRPSANVYAPQVLLCLLLVACFPALYCSSHAVVYHVKQTQSEEQPAAEGPRNETAAVSPPSCVKEAFADACLRVLVEVRPRA